MVDSQPSPSASSAAWRRSWWASSRRLGARGQIPAAGQVPEADDRQLRLRRQRLEVVALRAAPGEERGQVDVGLDEPPEPARPEVLPAHPELERPPPPGALEAELVEVELAGDIVAVVAGTSRLAAAVVLGPAARRTSARAAPRRGPPARRCRRPGRTTCGGRRSPSRPARGRGPCPRRARRAGPPRRRPHRRGTTVLRAWASSASHSMQVDRAGVRRARDRRDRERREARGPVAARSPRRTGSGWRRNRSSVGKHDERVGREAQLVERPPDREVGLVGRVDPDALERGTAGRAGQPAERRQADVTGERHRRGSWPSRRRTSAARSSPGRSRRGRTASGRPPPRRTPPSGPACQTSTPCCVDLGEQLARRSEHRERRRREVAQRRGDGRR